MHRRCPSATAFVSSALQETCTEPKRPKPPVQDGNAPHAVDAACRLDRLGAGKPDLRASGRATMILLHTVTQTACLQSPFSSPWGPSRQRQAKDALRRAIQLRNTSRADRAAIPRKSTTPYCRALPGFRKSTVCQRVPRVPTCMRGSEGSTRPQVCLNKL